MARGLAREGAKGCCSRPPGVGYTQNDVILRITMIDRLPEDTQTLYAEALALLLAMESERDWSHLQGSFSTKRIKGTDYVYFQYSDPGGTKRQFNVGRRTPAVDGAIAQREAKEQEVDRDREALARLGGLMRAAGIATLAHAPARVIRALVDAGVFRAGGVLVGSHAFQAVGNQLGVAWPGAAWRTQDVDIASHVRVAFESSEADVPRTLDSLQMGFVPVPQLDSSQPSSSFRVRGKTLRVDLLTPGSDGDHAPIFIPRLKAAAAPIKHLSLVMREAQPALTTDGTSASLVIVPTPARLALHKLLVSQSRSTMQQVKSGKDLHQAALLIEVLEEDRPDDLRQAAHAFAASGPAVSRRVLRGLQAAQRRWPVCEAGAALVRPILAS